MKRLHRFGCADWEEFVEDANNSVDLWYTNAKGEFWEFHLEPGGRGYELFDCENEVDYEYETLEEMMEKHIFPDGVLIKEAYNGENWIRMEGK